MMSHVLDNMLEVWEFNHECLLPMYVLDTIHKISYILLLIINKLRKIYSESILNTRFPYVFLVNLQTIACISHSDIFTLKIFYS